MRGRLADLSSLVYVYNFIRGDVHFFLPFFFIHFFVHFHYLGVRRDIC